MNFTEHTRARSEGHTHFFGAILAIAACLLPLSLSPPPPPSNTATMTTSILPRDVFFPKTPTVSSAITRTKTRNSTQRVLPWRFQFLSSNPPLLLGSRCSVLEHEFETPRSKSDATQLTLDDPEQSKAPLTSPFSVDSPRALDLKLEALRSKTSKTFFPLEKKRHQQFQFLLRVFIKKFNVWRERVQIRKNFFQ